MFFWEASQEVEEEKELGLIDENGKPHIGKSYIKSMRLDNAMGMIVSEIATWSIIVVAARHAERSWHHEYPYLGRCRKGT